MHVLNATKLIGRQSSKAKELDVIVDLFIVIAIKQHGTSKIPVTHDIHRNIKNKNNIICSSL